ncbi:MAG: hypothetical protein LKE89_10435 [Lactobacillaceae bacterium]|jgi:uncharacterized membrane protein|nr:hypothetical protein [Lactobacillaceae bacterium]
MPDELIIRKKIPTTILYQLFNIFLVMVLLGLLAVVLAAIAKLYTDGLVTLYVLFNFDGFYLARLGKKLLAAFAGLTLAGVLRLRVVQ